MAAALWGGDDALVSHAAAAVLWEFDGARAQKVELWVPTRAQGALGTRRGSSRYSGSIGPIGRRSGRFRSRLRPARSSTWRVDSRIIGSSPSSKTSFAAISSVRIGSTHVSTRSRTSGRPGGGRLEALLDARGDGRPLESALETLAWPIICSSGVPLPVRQHWVVLPGGRYRLDFAWPDLKIGLECEGHAVPRRLGLRGEKTEARFAEFAAAGWRRAPGDLGSVQSTTRVGWFGGSRTALANAA